MPDDQPSSREEEAPSVCPESVVESFGCFNWCLSFLVEDLRVGKGNCVGADKCVETGVEELEFGIWEGRDNVWKLHTCTYQRHLL
jgi:hypothetical protein